jgi:hypothetical protein
MRWRRWGVEVARRSWAERRVAWTRSGWIKDWEERVRREAASGTEEKEEEEDEEEEDEEDEGRKARAF